VVAQANVTVRLLGTLRDTKEVLAGVLESTMGAPTGCAKVEVKEATLMVVAPIPAADVTCTV
jgi:hypothetical protein